jgi:hypothetical protein
VKRVWGAEDHTKLETLRALDAGAVNEVAAKVGANDAGTLVRAFADAQREALEARRAAEKVKKDLAGTREEEKLTGDETSAVPTLKAAGALQRLMTLDAGSLTKEAHALAVMTAMERIESSRGLPKHLKTYAMQGSFTALFGAPEPQLPADATKRLPKGAYLAYLSDVAKAAGHPVPDAVAAPRDREPQAWAGVLAGLGEKLRPDVDGIGKDTPLADVVAHIVKRLDTETKPAPTPAGGASSAGAQAPKAGPNPSPNPKP